ncbi:hypothetical protein GCM10023224_32800 [Streptomonospora halophila]|uniref:Uncharacterized protein n=1 Tax=Streptomonospora halophila TaxID=427369 RepID=A0ABP9GP85_9ACTN
MTRYIGTDGQKALVRPGPAHRNRRPHAQSSPSYTREAERGVDHRPPPHRSDTHPERFSGGAAGVSR